MNRAARSQPNASSLCHKDSLAIAGAELERT
jgi:hypothetical protein